jgi:hypothetical protein
MDIYGERGLTHHHTPAESSPRARAVLSIGIGLYLLVLGGLGGTLVERIQFDQRREAVFARYDAALEARNARVMAIERAIAQRFAPAGTDLAAVPIGVLAAAASQ